VEARIRRLALLLLVASCGGGGDAPATVEDGAFGLETRVVVSGLTFPTGLPTPGPMSFERAFASLGFNRPTVLTNAGDQSDRIFVVEQDGRILVFPNSENVISAGVFLDIRPRVSRAGNEEGLLGLAFDPDYENNGYFYINYSLANPRRSRIARYSVLASDPNSADPNSEVALLEFAQPFQNHNGGGLAFGPDGKLYIGAGDGGSGDDPNNHAQTMDTVLGKVLRINPDGSIPPDNPFVSTPGARGEIWAYGLRNPWKITFDRDTGTLWAGDVGQNQVEEIDIIARGRNYGWRIYEGDWSNVNPNSDPPGAFEQPVHTYTHNDGQSVTGGYVYRGTRLPSLAGAYLYADFLSNRVWALVWDGRQVVSNTLLANVPLVATFGEDEAGEVYMGSFDGSIYRLVENSGGGPAFPQTLSATGLFSDTGNLVAAPGVIEYDVNSPLWSDNARKRRWIALPGQARVAFHPTQDWVFPVGTVLVKHFELDLAPNNTQRLETRVLVRHDAGWQGYTYRWNAQQTDANLLADSETQTYTVEDPTAPGGQRQQVWTFPSRADCITCHTPAAGFILGTRTRQLNRDFAYPARSDNQLRTWNHLRLFTTDIGSAGQYEALVDPRDPNAPIADRARSYLAANCANCHRPGTAIPVDMDLRYNIPTAQMNTHNVPATAGGGLRVSPGSHANSILWQRIIDLGTPRKPLLGKDL